MDKKSELGIKLDEWLASEEGRLCSADGFEGNDLAKRGLKNRLIAAFKAGAMATHAIAEELVNNEL